MRILGILFFCFLATNALAQEINVVSKPTEIERLTKELQRSLNVLSPATKIQKCSPMVLEAAGEDEIFGAFCYVSIKRQNLRLLMCDDKMVDKFTASLRYLEFETLPAETVVDFVATNCPPGG